MNEPSTSHPEVEAVLFDIDGTLITSGGAGRAAWRAAISELHGVEVDTRETTESGMTDPEVARAVLGSVLEREPDRREVSAAMGRYLGHLDETVRDSEGYRVLPGVEGLLTRLVASGMLLGLTTGNVEAAAHIKLSRGRLNRFFCFGGYGSDSADRAELTRCALRRADMVSGGELELSECICIGDTPRDIAAGHAAGVRVVGVATGDYDFAALDEAGADWTVETVEDGFPV